ncbi:MAG: hypothetical protein K8W52_07805, partial [Deltaproteobacteria bacterium]|nr:hypothetical protein [Deltaproteobacteria bacterium]
METTAAEAREPTPKVMASLMAALDGAMEELRGSGFDTNEATALALTNELARRWCEAELARLAATIGAEVQVDGAHYRRHATGVGVYHGLCGAMRVRRERYRRVGVRNGPTLVPLELVAGLVEGATPAFGFSVAQGYAAMPLRHYEQELRAAHRVPPARATIERMAKRLGAAMRAAIPRVEPVARAAERVPAAAVAISVGLDRTSTPMEEARDAWLPPGPRQRRRAPYRRRVPEPVQVNYRMAYVGTFALHDAAGAVLVSRRFAATASEGPADVIARVFAEVAHAQGQRPTLPLAIVQDGAPELWNLMTAGCARHGITPAVELIDRYHLDEHIAALLDLVAATDGCAEILRRRWAAALDRSDTAIDRIARDLDLLNEALAWNTRAPAHLAPHVRRHVRGAKSRELSRHIEYIHNHRRRMRYATAGRAGFPIGSGVTEGACKSMITVRCKRGGQRWRERGLTACLALRTQHLNERL